MYNMLWTQLLSSVCGSAAPKPRERLQDSRARVLDTDELIDLLQSKTQQAVHQRQDAGTDAHQVGLVCQTCNRNCANIIAVACSYSAV